ncbi:MAG: hypothetical protein LRZ85_02690 [Alphaproteobacteria bacterium]|nr:hypothetical protein [Alphaproteobacteria bacterium]
MGFSMGAYFIQKLVQIFCRGTLPFPKFSAAWAEPIENSVANENELFPEASALSTGAGPSFLSDDIVVSRAAVSLGR